MSFSASSWDWFATSFRPSVPLYQKIASIVTSAPELNIIKSVTSGSMALGLQPISSSVVRAGNARGGNPLGLESANQTWFVLDAGWWDASGDDKMRVATQRIRDRIERAAREEGEHVEYLFMNDASHDQDVIKHYGPENVRRLKHVQRKYDPSLIFQRLVPGGWKLPGVG